MEARLKADVLREAARYDQHILVTEEDDDMNVREGGRGVRWGEGWHGDVGGGCVRQMIAGKGATPSAQPRQQQSIVG